ncbi:hypothetical protein M427DRAFT_477298 [Gonapodya prolifera JEL478]|uniref:Uncharacterized protein n=1 Tax=Gonapodya prolifera (strain JEL478) TaxID=1344416 RepID=A0A139A143_GONPJ|nr:hypothetical protein M427DRAFT_477298 [Gonapodya prolifera JEL478]|eukprot:KXS10489.1 hypothetical protein M427DRAFT_477298 [Gonapodya prolifera JEL478]
MEWLQCGRVTSTTSVSIDRAGLPNNLFGTKDLSSTQIIRSTVISTLLVGEVSRSFIHSDLKGRNAPWRRDVVEGKEKRKEHTCDRDGQGPDAHKVHTTAGRTAQSASSSAVDLILTVPCGYWSVRFE